MVMILADEPEFARSGVLCDERRCEDQMMGSPSDASPEQLRDLHIKIDRVSQNSSGQLGDYGGGRTGTFILLLVFCDQSVCACRFYA